MNLSRLLPLAAFALVIASPPARAQTAVDLGTASQFAILAGTGITFAGTGTLITGNIGSHAVATIVNPGNVTFVSGSNHGGDGLTQTAKADLAAAYADIAGRASTPISGTLGGTTLTPGIYQAGTFNLTGNLTLDGNGLYIFQAGSTLDTAIGSQVLLINGAQPYDVFWQVGSSATLLSSSVFAGNILALTSISVGSDNVIDGRLLASGGAVTLAGNNNVISVPEPSTYALLGGVAALALVAFRRRQPRATRG